MRPTKRAFDLFFVIPGLIVCAPIFAVAGIIVKVGSKGPVFFKQTRIGRNGKPFQLFKFRTMVTDAPKMGPAITIGEDPRITKAGKFLRKTKLDELPQLWNVFLGDMSLVGPRPETPTYVESYTAEQRKVLDLVPGITDPSSIKYRNESELLGLAEDPQWTYTNEILPDKLNISIRYGANSSVWTDFGVILETLLPRKHS